MAKISLIIDSRRNSKSKVTGLFPIVLSVYHKKSRFIRMDVSTSLYGWDETRMQLKKSAPVNRNLDCDALNTDLDRKFFIAKELLREIGQTIDTISVDRLVELIKNKWDENPNSEIKRKLENEISLIHWAKVIIRRSINADSPSTAGWYQQGVDEIIKYNNGSDIMLYDITVTFLKNFESHHKGKGTSINTIGIYLRSLRSIYNKSIDEDQFTPIKNVFKYYKIPATTRTKKRAISKEEILSLYNLEYEEFSPLWNTKNYALVMFYCKGMNFIDLVKIKVDHINGDRIYYGRSKTGTSLSVLIHHKLKIILNFYLADKKSGDYLFPTNYDGSSKHYQKYKSQRRRMNNRLKIIAHDAGIEANLTTYTIRHSWATIAKYLGISTALISESLGHSSIKTTEIYLKDFDDYALDEVNELVTV